MFFDDLNAIDATTGEKLWSQDLGESAAAYRERPAKSRRGGRLYNARMAHEDRAGLEGASASHRRRRVGRSRRVAVSRDCAASFCKPEEAPWQRRHRKLKFFWLVWSLCC